MLKDKKGFALEQLYPAVMLIIVVGIGLGIGVFILNETAEATSNTAKTVINQSYANMTETQSVALDRFAECGAHDFAVSQCIIANGSVIPSSNYTFTESNTIITYSGGVNTYRYNGSAWECDYTYLGTPFNKSTDACGSFEAAGTGVGGFADWIAVIVVVIAAAIVLGIVIESFGNKSAV